MIYAGAIYGAVWATVLGFVPSPLFLERASLTLGLSGASPAEIVLRAFAYLAVAVEPAAAGKPFVVLVVDDNPTNRKLAVRQLENLGYETDAAEDGVKALAKLDQRHFDAVLLDMQMPELDGCQPAVEIRRREEASPSGRRIPLIAMTASTLVSDREACLAAGMNELAALRQPDELVLDVDERFRQSIDP